MIILSDKYPVDGNGLGGLAEAISCKVVHEVNGEYELVMQYPVTGIRYDDIVNGRFVLAKPDKSSTEQAFRIYRITKPVNGIITIYARHIAYDMSGVIVNPMSANDLQGALRAVKQSCVPETAFTITSTRAVSSPFRVDEPTALWALLGGMQGSFLDVYGGEWDFDNLTADLKSRLGANRGVSVRYGKNLTNLEQDATIEEAYAYLYPYWYDEETGTMVRLDSYYIPIPDAEGERVLLVDFTDDFDDPPTKQDLLNRANKYIQDNEPGKPKVSWKVSFVQLENSGESETAALLEKVVLGDTVNVRYDPLNLDAESRVVKTEYDCLAERLISCTLGRVKQNLAKIIASTPGEIKKAVQAAKSAMERAIEQSTDFITHGAGYMRFIYNQDNELMEIVSLDNPDISMAQSVWRWNNGGFGHSSTGYNGPYTTAITQNGAIVADFITAGVLDAALIKAGILSDATGRNYWNMQTGEMNFEALDVIVEKLGNIGGRNLLIRSATRHISPYNSNLTFVDGISVPEWGTDEAIGVTGSGQNYTFGNLLARIVGEYEEGVKYTLSVYVKNNGDYPIYVYPNGNGAVKESIGPDEVKRVVITQDQVLSANLGMNFMTDEIGQAVDFVYWHPKIETGEVATAWTPAPEDMENDLAAAKAEIKVTTDELGAQITQKVSKTDYNGNTIASLINQTATTIQIDAQKINLNGYVTFDNLHLGGRNLARGTQYMKNDSGGWSVGGWRTTPANSSSGTVAYGVTISDSPVPNCGKGVRITATDTTSYVGITQDTYPALQAGPYTVSVWVKGTAGDTVRFEGWYWYEIGSSATSGTVTKTISQTGVWERLTATFTKDISPIGHSASICFITFKAARTGNSVLLCAPMMEYGNTASSWTPAPEDNPTFADLATAGQTIIDGGNITTGTINANLVRAGVLSDVAGKNSWNLTTGNLIINGGKIEVSAQRVFKPSDYSQTDLDVIRDIILGDKITDDDALNKYDFDGSGSISGADLIILRDLLNGTIPNVTMTIKTSIDGNNAISPIYVEVSNSVNQSVYKSQIAPGRFSSNGSIIAGSAIFNAAVSSNHTRTASIDGVGFRTKSIGIYGDFSSEYTYDGLYFRNGGNVTASYWKEPVETSYIVSNATLTFSPGTIYCRKTGSNGVFHINLHLANGASFAAGTEYVIATLNSGDRPKYNIYHQIPSESGKSSLLLQIKTTGEVSIYRYASSAAWGNEWCRAVIPAIF